MAEEHTPEAVTAIQEVARRINLRISQGGLTIPEIVTIIEEGTPIYLLLRQRDELLEACKLSEGVLAEHEQYDPDPEDETSPSRESEAAEACRAAINKVTNNPQQVGE